MKGDPEKGVEVCRGARAASFTRPQSQLGGQPIAGVALVATSALRLNRTGWLPLLSTHCCAPATAHTHLQGKAVLVTGSTDGIGKHTAALLAQQGATTLVHGRNRARVQRTLRELRSHTANPAVYAYCYDMSSLAQTRAFAEHLRRDLQQHFGGRWVGGWQLGTVGGELRRRVPRGRWLNLSIRSGPDVGSPDNPAFYSLGLPQVALPDQQRRRVQRGAGGDGGAVGNPAGHDWWWFSSARGGGQKGWLQACCMADGRARPCVQSHGSKLVSRLDTILALCAGRAGGDVGGECGGALPADR